MPPSPIIDCVAVSSKDLATTLKFYECLGFRFPELTDDTRHIEAMTEPGAVRLMIDTAELMEELTGQTPRAGSHSGFGLLCDSPATVDSYAAGAKAAGFEVVTEPWDAFWGQRYATVKDPDGYQVDLFAPL